MKAPAQVQVHVLSWRCAGFCNLDTFQPLGWRARGAVACAGRGPRAGLAQTVVNLTESRRLGTARLTDTRAWTSAQAHEKNGGKGNEEIKYSAGSTGLVGTTIK
jgi:hypothetical protein